MRTARPSRARHVENVRSHRRDRETASSGYLTFLKLWVGDPSLEVVSHSYYLRIYCAKKLSLLSSIAFQIQTTPTPGEDHDLMIHHYAQGT